MLIEFSVSNYRSFREKQTFSMVAAPRLRKKENVFKPNVKGEKLPDLLKVAAIYGPNASGKSNLLRAMEVIVLIAKASPSTSSKPIPVTPFRFDKELVTQPSRFELHFVHRALRYQFELAATPERIVGERLVAFPNGKETLLYDRLHTGTTDKYEFGDNLEGGEDLYETWRKLTGPKTLFISQAVANSSEDLTQLREPFDWLREGMDVVLHGMSRFAGGSQSLAKRNSEIAKQISLFLQDLDVPVTQMKFESTTDSSETETENVSDVEERGTSLLKEATLERRATFTHKTALGEADIDFEEESEGTKALVGFWLPWIVYSHSHSHSPFRFLAVDELDSSLHPEIVASIVRRHLQFETPAQLIFSTHDTHLMDTGLLRRDQIWLTERDINGATQVRSIHEFEGRESEDVEKRYYEGRYRGLPVLRKS